MQTEMICGVRCCQQLVLKVLLSLAFLLQGLQIGIAAAALWLVICPVAMFNLRGGRGGREIMF